MDSHDGIMTLLNMPDPIEKGLALKSKHVEPYHLRHALQDADFHIRSIAAKHPKLTRELMREILSSDDKDLRHIVLARPDIDEHELSIVAKHPDHAAEVARHPKTTDALRNEALDHPHLAEGVKVEHLKALAKNIGHITFPLLGEGRVYTKPMGVASRNQATARQKYVTENKKAVAKIGQAGNMSFASADGRAAEPAERTMSGWVAPNPNPKASKETSQRLKVALPNASPIDIHQSAKEIDQGKSLNATEAHEAQHAVFGRIAQKHGQNAALRVIATTLSKLPEEHRNHIQSLFNATGTHLEEGAATLDPEEGIAYLHNYLQDPNRRKEIHQRLGLHTKDEQHDSYELARKAWNNLRRIGMSLRPEEVGIDPKDESNRMASWIKNLSKRESIPSDQLGFSVSFHELIAIAQFLTQTEIALSTIRQALRENGGDPKEAVLTAYGLNTPEGKKAFDNVKMLKLHKSEDVLKEPKSIVGIDNDEIAQIIQLAYKNKEVESVSLGGKHSSGAHIAKDEDNVNWLLKPGSGKKSPAAGVDETKGSQSRREAAFSALAKLLGIEEVKTAHVLQVDGREVAAIQMWPMNWVNLHRAMFEDGNLSQRALEPYRRNGKMFRWSVLDYVAGNPDRHGNNLMVGPADEGNKVGLIDHGSAFAGPSFDPGNDQDSFVPYYLRAWAGPGFHGLAREEQLNQMPVLSGEADDSLREWVDSINPAELEQVLIQYGLDPGPAKARLAKIQSDPIADNMSRHINQCWLASPSE